MTTTRISHTGHNHPNTTAARTACRKAMKATTPAVKVTTLAGHIEEIRTNYSLEIATVGNGSRFHYIDKAVGTTRCGKVQPVFVRMGSIAEVDCKGCRSKYGQAHG